ncbi:uncharacterized protein LOC131665310 [Phymastichus coffea]|uniref:uncharacterized protein LOC131665310 n=1 Tax=Phymastichus coffea TaxID=108790 RepID=UPI00273AB806|nr:uncharacterized protein LOC131665310 [Phymastichus coffea]
MALTGKQEGLIHVPWSSTEEWHRVYKKIYSGDITEQIEAHEILLVWKARIPKLPVGVECTLGLIQVCLRDQEWIPKITNGEMPNSYENDLRMMYSTAIMKFLNHISNIAHKKQTSLFLIAKQLNIPEWIVDLRHDTAHGHELPSIDVMRIVANILLAWLHEEYWAAEANNLQTSELDDSEASETESQKTLIDLFELWTAVSLYIKVQYAYVSDLPDAEMRKTIENVVNKTNSKVMNNKMKLTSVLNTLLLELSKSLSKDDTYSRKGRSFIDSVLNNEAFLTSSEILFLFTEESNATVKNCLPINLIDFWENILLLLQEKKLLLLLFLELIELIKDEKDQNRKLLAALWVKTLAQAYNKQKIARSIYQTLEQDIDDVGNSFSNKVLIDNVHQQVNKRYPELRNVFSLNIHGEFPHCLTEKSFVKRLILHSNEFSEHYVPEILKISSFLSHDPNTKDKILELLKVQSYSKQDKMETANTCDTDQIYTVTNIKKIEQRKCTRQNTEHTEPWADRKIRNTKWNIADANHDWSLCPIGTLPWKINDFQPIEPMTVPQSDIRYAIIRNTEMPKIIDSNRLKLHSKIQWENIIKKKKQTKKKSMPSEITVISRVVENVKSMQNQS